MAYNRLILRHPFAKFIPQRSHLPLPVFLQSSSPTESSSPTGILAIIIPNGNEESHSSTSAQDLSSRHPSRIYFPRRNTFINISHFIHPDTCIYASYHTISFIFENIVTSCISYIMTLHTTDVLPFQEKGQSKDDYYQLSQFHIRFLYLARAYL